MTLQTARGSKIVLEPRQKEEDDLAEVERKKVKLAHFLAVKDRFFISDECVHEMRHIPGVDIPPLNQIKDARQEQSGFLPVEHIPEVG